MADKMTLEQVLAEMLSCRGCDPDYVNEITRRTFDRWTDVLSAHLAEMGEPVAWQMTVETHKKKPKWRDCSFKEYTSIAATGLFVSPDGLTFPAKARVLYTDQPASGDWGKVREVIANIRLKLERERDAGKASLTEWAGELTAALPESQP